MNCWQKEEKKLSANSAMPQNNIAILSTSPLQDSLIKEAKESNIEVDVVSFIGTESLDSLEITRTIEDASVQSATVIFTSVNAVKAVADKLKNRIPDWSIYCIGSATRRSVEDCFRQVKIAGSADSALELAKLIIKDSPTNELVFFCGDQRREELPDFLRSHNRKIKLIVVYKTVAIRHKLAKQYQGILFFSPSGVQSFFSDNKADDQTVFFAIGDTTATALKKFTGNLIRIGDKPEKENLFRKMIKHFGYAADTTGGATVQVGSKPTNDNSVLKNDLLLKALKGEKVSRPPVWMMRQAGRYLPDYIKIREKYDFFTRCKTPELAAAITLQPVDQVGVDAAIIFSDILVIPQAMGVEVQLEENKGPILPKTIRTLQDIDALISTGAEESLKYVYDAIALTKKELNGRVPLIGFAGAPWTILCYLVEGKGSKTWDLPRQFAFTHPELAHRLLQKITSITIEYLKCQVKAGADTIQVFDSWSGVLSPEDFKVYAQPYLFQIADALKNDAPVILFPKGSWYALKDVSESSASAMGVDWCISPKLARQLSQDKITLQGNFDPSKLLMPIPEIKKMVKEMIDAFGSQRYIANLGHGITPNVPVDHAKAFVEAVKEYK